MWDVYSQLVSRVDVALRGELDSHFHARSQAHQRQWAALLEKQIHERDRFATDISDQILELGTIVGSKLPAGVGQKLANISAAADAIQQLDARPMSQLTRKDLERRLFRESLKHWGQQERFNLQEAAALQKARVDAEWGTYLEQVEEEFRAQRAAAEGKVITAITDAKRAASGRKASVSDTRTGPWRNAEKQSRLVHTAPVLTPETFGGRRPSQNGGVAVRRKSSAIVLDKELAAIDAANAAAVERVGHQKGMAIRWIDRQTLRMTCHLDHVEKDKELLLQYLEKEEVEAQAVQGWIKTFAATARAFTQTRRA